MGQNNATVADGLAVPRASEMVAQLVAPLVDAVVTVSDAALLAEVRRQWHTHGLRLEPSAAAGFVAHAMERPALGSNTRTVVWTTGGNGLPDAVFLPLVS